VSKPVLQAATVPLPAERGDFGSGVVELLGPQDVFVSLVQYGDMEVGTRLFKDGARPRQLTADQFRTNQLQRWQPGQAGLQVFFTDAGRAFCLYVVLGSFGERVRLVGEVNRLLVGLRIGAGGRAGSPRVQ